MCWTRVAVFAVSLFLASDAYDYSSSCEKPYRSGRADSAPQLPCDLSKQVFCNSPGSAYPWRSVRRFVHENQGLMRRMYGEQRHISVLRSEIEDIAPDDYPESFSPATFAEDIIKTKKNHRGRAINVRPHFRPIQTTPSTKTTAETNKKITSTDKSTTIKTKINVTESNETADNDDMSFKSSFLYKEATKLESIANIEINHIEPEAMTLEAVIKQSIEYNSVYPNYAVSSKTEPLIPPTTNPLRTNYENTTVDKTPNTTEIVADDKSHSNSSNKDEWIPIEVDKSTLPPTMLFSEHEKLNKNDRLENNVTEKVKEEFHLKPQHQESVRPTVINLRGVNACSVTEEIVAPFWANNTRGEVLALLNMYPFEQYVHWEKCTNEHKQMYCREGCRCEQQYRLHRLLAYDPNNECRGIFSDWFRFPSCCVCKCYDVPLEYRVTSRSPRLLAPQYGDDVKRAIYQDAASDWYTISTFDDDDEL